MHVWQDGCMLVLKFSSLITRYASGTHLQYTSLIAYLVSVSPPSRPQFPLLDSSFVFSSLFSPPLSFPPAFLTAHTPTCSIYLSTCSQSSLSLSLSLTQAMLTHLPTTHPDSEDTCLFDNLPDADAHGCRAGCVLVWFGQLDRA